MLGLHLCIDMQDREFEKIDTDTAALLKASAVKCIDFFKEQNIPTLYVAMVEPELPCVGKPSILGEFNAVKHIFDRKKGTSFGIPVPEDALVVIKPYHSALQRTDLGDVIDMCKPETIYLSGMKEATTWESCSRIEAYFGCCVSTTAYSCADIDYKTIIVANATDLLNRPLDLRQATHRELIKGIRVEPLDVISREIQARRQRDSMMAKRKAEPLVRSALAHISSGDAKFACVNFG